MRAGLGFSAPTLPVLSVVGVVVTVDFLVRSFARNFSALFTWLCSRLNILQTQHIYTNSMNWFNTLYCDPMLNGTAGQKVQHIDSRMESLFCFVTHFLVYGWDLCDASTSALPLPLFAFTVTENRWVHADVCDFARKHSQTHAVACTGMRHREKKNGKTTENNKNYEESKVKLRFDRFGVLSVSSSHFIGIIGIDKALHTDTSPFSHAIKNNFRQITQSWPAKCMRSESTLDKR